MTDLVCSLTLLGLVVLGGAAYGVLALTRGAKHYARVERDGGSAFLGTGAMSAGYWALQPVGRSLVRAGVSPNTITLASLAVGFAASASLALGHFGVAAALVAVATAGDGLDGLVARATGRTSEAGEALDAAADRYQEFAFLAGLTFHYRAHGAWVVLTLAALLGSVMTSYVSAKAEALRVQVPRGAMRRPERAVYLTFGVGLTPVARHVIVRLGVSDDWGHAPALAALAAVALVANASSIARLVALMRALDARTPPSSGDAPQTPSGRGASAATIVRHQAGAAAATFIDFGTLTVAVEIFRVSPSAGTALGASLGALTNFTLSRRWVFRGSGGRAGEQALRYALISAASLGLNTMGEYALAQRLGAPYLAARAIVAMVVSLLWNFPMHRHFVFRRTSEHAI